MGFVSVATHPPVGASATLLSVAQSNCKTMVTV